MKSSFKDKIKGLKNNFTEILIQRGLSSTRGEGKQPF